MTVFETLKDWQKLKGSSGFGFRSLGFVPTMGALHDGHLSLIEKSKNENDRTLVSIFINPTQFNDPTDFEKYPRNLNHDMAILEAAKVDYVLLPHDKEIYADHYKYKIVESEVSQILCGKYRPGHFQGMLTVVLKLLNLADAHRAYFGEKDYQQYLLIKEMADSFFLKTQIVSCPTIRESDGLALSSRNQRLSKKERTLAALFPQVLMGAETPALAVSKLKNSGFKVDYIEEYRGRRFGAVHLGEVRLIDNVKI